MRYSQSKEQSAELLRLVLARMGQHDASFTPMTFTVWFEYAAGINLQLNDAIDRLMQSLLAKAFRGELVPTEAELAHRENRTYEPAIQLLERIRKTQTSTIATRKRGSKESATG